MNLKIEEIFRNSGITFLLNKYHSTRFLFSVIRGIVVTLSNTNMERFVETVNPQLRMPLRIFQESF